MARHSKRPQRFSSMLPKGKRQRRETELLGGIALVLFASVIVGTFFASGLQRYAMRSPNVAAVVSAILVDLANTDRSQNNLGALTINPVLVAAAQAKANDMAEKGYFAHVSPEGVDPWHWFQEVGYTFTYAGENLAVNFSDSNDVNTAWMNSPSHRENILNAHFTEIGIATAEGMYEGRPTTFVVQEFGAPAAKSAPVAVQSAVVPTSPTEPALARGSGAAVLGSAAHPAPLAEKVEKKPVPPARGNLAVASTEQKQVAPPVQQSPQPAPLWAYAVGFPRTTLLYVYYMLGVLILGALAFDTGLEWHRRHARKAVVAGTLLGAMCILFAVANYLFFVQPVLALTGASS